MLEQVRAVLPDIPRPVVMADVLAALGLARRRTRTNIGLQYRVWN